MSDTRLDVDVSEHGTVVLMTPLTDTGEGWLKKNAPDALWLNGAMVVDSRYALDILDGMESDGLGFEAP